MHTTSFENARRFFETYRIEGGSIIEIGSQDVNGSIRQCAPTDCQYTGLDFQAGKGVDIVIEDPYSLPLASDSCDICVTTSCLEHSELFWLSFLEMVRIVRNGGLIYINVPSNGTFHRYPVDCWRFYPDAGLALQHWAQRSGQSVTMLESFVSNQAGREVWSDFCAVFLVGESTLARYPNRIINKYRDFCNGHLAESKELIQPAQLTEDLARLTLIERIIDKSLPIKWN